MRQDAVGPTETIRCQAEATALPWRRMMEGYRKSYWKTVLAAAVLTLVCGSLVTVWVAMKEIVAPGLALTQLQHPASFWALVTVVSACALAGAAVLTGGAMCLYREWRQLQ